jgi:hypothetical protein
MNKPAARVFVLALSIVLAGVAVPAGQLQRNSQIAANQALYQIARIADVNQVVMDFDAETDLKGTNLGATQGTRKLRVDGTLATFYHLWNDNGFIFAPPTPFIYWDHVYKFEIVDGMNVVSNVFTKRIPWNILGVTPANGPAGTIVDISVYRLLAANNGFVLKIGSLDMPIVSWTGGGTIGTIKAKVPAGLAPGAYIVYLQKGGETASKKSYQFTVLIPLSHIPIPPIK